MSDNKSKNSRRKFLNRGIFMSLVSVFSAGFISVVSSKKSDALKDTEMVKMLTSDGEVVEVEKRIFDKKKNITKTKNSDILSWMSNHKKA